MTMPDLWRIKPLEWSESCNGRWHEAEAPIGHLFVHRLIDGRWEYRVRSSEWLPCSSLSDGKSKCEALYNERMARGLEPVEGVGVEDVMELADAYADARAFADGTVDARVKLESAIRTLAGQERGE